MFSCSVLPSTVTGSLSMFRDRAATCLESGEPRHGWPRTVPCATEVGPRRLRPAICTSCSERSKGSGLNTTASTTEKVTVAAEIARARSEDEQRVRGRAAERAGGVTHRKAARSRNRGAAARIAAPTAARACRLSQSVVQRGPAPRRHALRPIPRGCRRARRLPRRQTRSARSSQTRRASPGVGAHRGFSTDSRPAVIVLMRASDWRTACSACGLARKYRFARPPRTGVGSP